MTNLARYLRGPVRGVFAILAGAVSGIVVGFVMEGDKVTAAFQGWHTVWRDCGPLVFMPMFMGGMIALFARLRLGPLGGVLMTIFAGAGAGYASPSVFARVFGMQPAPVGFASIPDVLPLLSAAAGVAAAIFWRLGIDRFFE